MSKAANRNKHISRGQSRSRVRRQSRFDEMMENLLAGGSLRCPSCGLLRPASRFDQHGYACNGCVFLIKYVQEGPPRPQHRALADSGGIVYVDASYDDGYAGLAVVGALGEHHRSLSADSSVQAEVLALGWAISIAYAGKLRDLTFRTDCQAAYEVHKDTGKKLGWTVEWVSRRHNVEADRLAGLARRAWGT